MDGYDNLVSIEDIGPRAAAVFVAGIGDVNDFESADKLVAYLGIVFRVDCSNEIDNPERITTLVQCTLTAVRYSGHLNTYCRRIEDRRGTGKAIIAIASPQAPRQHLGGHRAALAIGDHGQNHLPKVGAVILGMAVRWRMCLPSRTLSTRHR